MPPASSPRSKSPYLRFIARSSIQQGRSRAVLLVEDAVPEESAILRFRQLIEDRQRTEAILDELRYPLADRICLGKSDTSVDPTSSQEPSSLKNEAGARPPEMRPTRKGKNWKLGMKLRLGTGVRGK